MQVQTGYSPIVLTVTFDPGDHFAGWPILTLTEDWQNGGAEGPDAKYLVSRILADLSASKLFFCLSV